MGSALGKGHRAGSRGAGVPFSNSWALACLLPCPEPHAVDQHATPQPQVPTKPLDQGAHPFTQHVQPNTHSFKNTATEVTWWGPRWPTVVWAKQKGNPCPGATAVLMLSGVLGRGLAAGPCLVHQGRPWPPQHPDLLWSHFTNSSC